MSNNDDWNESFVEKRVNYFLEVDGQLLVIENVPARVSLETGEQLFSPETVERLQQLVWQRKKPARVIKTPVYEYTP
jgi:hypothetical protein